MACLLLAAGAHLGALAALDWPAPSPSAAAPTLAITLTNVALPAAVVSDAPSASLDQRQEPLPQTARPAAEAPAELGEPRGPEPPVARRWTAGGVAQLARAVATRAPAAERRATGERTLRLDPRVAPRSDFAFYLASWQRKVERIGQLNYPREAKARGTAGSLRLLVAIAADGALRKARVLESSGHAVLDAAALRIVRLAAPYAPFSPAMRETAEVLEIERTWRFRNSRLAT